MFILKVYYHLWALMGKWFYKIIYFKNLKMGYSVSWRKSFRILISKDAKLTIGNNCFFNNYCSITAHHRIKIGNNVLFGEGVKIYDHNHRFNQKNKLVRSQGFSDGEVIIGNNCWIGSNVIILKGTKIGNNSVIAAGSVISDDIPNNSIVKGEKNYFIEKIEYK